MSAGPGYARLLLACAVACAVSAPAAAQETPETRELRQRIEKLEQQNETLQRAIQGQTAPADKPPDKLPEEPKKDCPPDASKPMPLSAVWDNSLFFVSADKAWRVHIGGRFQFNSVWWNQPDYLKGLPVGPGGVPNQGPGGGVGPLDDGTYFRRVRFRADGSGYEQVEFVEEVNFENLNRITFDHVWVGLKDVPWIGTIRIGQMKVPQSMDMIGSDYYLTFLERSALSDAFWTLFAPGVLVANTYFDQNVTTQGMVHKVQPLQFYDGASFGDGNWAMTSRMTWTPYYADNGTYLVHLGFSQQWRTGNLGSTIGGTGNAFADSQNVIRFRARPELRDAAGINPTLVGNANRFVDTGYLLSNSVETISPEFMTTCGPWNFRAEAAWSFARDVRSIYPNADFLVNRGNPTFWGGYVQASYFLTGEHWGYDRRFGVYDRPKVRENAYFLKGDDCKYHCGTGAWELAYRFSFVDLNDNGINGGQLTEHTFGVNWYLNDNFRLQANYLNIQRNVAPPPNSGTVHGFGMQAQWYF